MSVPYPLTFDPILLEKVWGGRRLGAYGKALAPGRSYGESWELADLAATSPSGGGGEAAQSMISAGPLAGKTIRDAVKRWGGELLGVKGLVAARSFGYRGGPVFPLLIKYLDAAEHLSVQTHPSPEFAMRHPDAALKTESWVVLEAEPTTRPDGVREEPSVFIGVKPGVNEDRFRSKVAAGEVHEVIERAAAVPGDCWTLPSGTVHALGAGVLVAEVQTPSDTTFRLYDWQREYGRPSRAMHVDEAVRCMSFGGSGGIESAPRARGLGRLATTPYYTIDAAEPGDGMGLTVGACCVLMVLAGEAEVACCRGGFEKVIAPKGRTVVVPAACAESALVRGSGDGRVLVVKIGAG